MFVPYWSTLATTHKALMLLTVVLFSPRIAADQSTAIDHSDIIPQDALRIEREYKPVVDTPHPDFILPSIDGDRDIQLSNYRGKKVLLLHFASW
jgi:hypothetical protein